MVSILNLVVTFAVLLASFLMARYFILALALCFKGEELLDRALRIASCVMTVASVSWIIVFMWLVHTDFVRMKISLWVREIYFTIQDGRLLELLLK